MATVRIRTRQAPVSMPFGLRSVMSCVNRRRSCMYTPAVCDNSDMKFRTGLVVGLGVGYVLGAKAGRRRYEQIMALASKLRSNESVKKAADVAERRTRRPRGIAGDGLVKAANTVRTKAASDRTGTNGSQPDSK